MKSNPILIIIYISLLTALSLFAKWCEADNLRCTDQNGNEIKCLNITNIYKYTIDGYSVEQYGMKCDSGNCISRSEIRDLLKASFKVLLFEEGILHSLQRAPELSSQILKAIKCLDKTNDECKLLN